MEKLRRRRYTLEYKQKGESGMKLEARRVWFCCLLVFLVCPLTPQAQGFRYVGSSSREFVEQFYKWYVPLALSDQVNRSWDAALKLAPPPFSPELTKLLRGDAVAQAECKELVGLDFDPFLYTQDPAQAYVVGKIVHTGQYYRAEIYSVDHSVQSKEPGLIAEFTQEKGHWLFVNFYYLSPKSDLLTVLKGRAPCTEPRGPAQK
jgi:hypothetical protein